MVSSAAHLAVFALAVSVVSAVSVCCCALFYLRRVRLERPPIGAFNGRDMAILFVFLSTVPLFYLTLPRWLLTAFLVVTFLASLSIGFRPVLGPAVLWPAIGLLLGLNLWMGSNALGTVLGWQLFWAENSVVVLLGAVSVSNLYVQGGMKLRHVAWFALVLGAYDAIFTTVYPVTNALVEEFLGYPLDPSMGMRWHFDNAAIGLGDLLVYSSFLLAAYKAYGRRAGRLALAVVVVFGAALPSLAPLLIDYVDPRTDTLVPAQTWFGPAALLTYRWLRRRHGEERTMQEFLAGDDVVRPPASPQVGGVAAPEPAVGAMVP
jgi:hypothetical protein